MADPGSNFVKRFWTIVSATRNESVISYDLQEGVATAHP